MKGTEVPKSLNHRWVYGLLLLAGLYFLFAYVVQFSPAAPKEREPSTCIHEKHELSHGRSPAGQPWRVVATIDNNGSCREWLLGVEFFPAGTYAGSWRGAWGIPAEGHLPRHFTISARDEIEDSERAFSGVVGSEAKTLVLVASDGKRSKINPKLPTVSMRRKFVWLRNMRYFVYFYSAGKSVRTVKLLDAQGRVVHTVQGIEGGFDGPM